MKWLPIDLNKRDLARAGGLAALILGSLISLNCNLVVPRQGWSAKWGPMVPHRKFPADCSLCHITEGWEVIRSDFVFDHLKETGYPLEGAHARAACLRCHNDRGPVQFYSAKGCWGCHEDPHQSQLGLDCLRCHNQQTWRPEGLIAEHARTRFPLAGVHTITPCESCHLQAPVGDYRGASPICALCHQRDLVRATNPDHLATGMVTSCERCHTSLGWGQANFTHDFFPLLGGHGSLQCVQCHTSGKFTKLPTDCYSCHRADYERAPNHVSSNYPKDCTRCHSIISWNP